MGGHPLRASGQPGEAALLLLGQRLPGKGNVAVSLFDFKLNPNLYKNCPRLLVALKRFARFAQSVINIPDVAELVGLTFKPAYLLINFQRLLVILKRLLRVAKGVVDITDVAEV